MIRLVPVVGLLCAALIAGGCGGGMRSGSGASVASVSTSTSTSTPTPAGAATASTSTTTSSAAATRSGPFRTRHRPTATHAGPKPSGAVGHDGARTGSSGGRGGSAGGAGIAPAHYARLPATFTITSGGGLAPTAVSLPAVGSVTFTVISRDARAHHVALHMPSGMPGVTVVADGRATALLRGIKPGRYVVDVDGLARGLVLVGGTPGTR